MSNFERVRQVMRTAAQGFADEIADEIYGEFGDKMALAKAMKMEGLRMAQKIATSRKATTVAIEIGKLLYKVQNNEE